MKSNFLKSVAPEEPAQESQKEAEKPETAEEEEAPLTEAEIAERKEQEIQKQLERTQTNAISFLNLDTSSIYSIF